MFVYGLILDSLEGVHVYYQEVSIFTSGEEGSTVFFVSRLGLLNLLMTIYFNCLLTHL